MRTFQSVLLGIFGFFIVAGVIVIATFGKSGGSGEDVPAEAIVWGTLPADIVNSVVSKYNEAQSGALQVTYEAFSEAEFKQELIDALASGTGPDAIIVQGDHLAEYEDKLYTVPFESITERLFRDTYTQGSEIFVSRNGILGLPILVDPLMMYWNRTLLNTARLPEPPRFWDELVDFHPKLTKVDDSFNVLQSVIALGEYGNVDHAREIIATLIMQAGNPITLRDAGNRLGVIIADDLGLPEAPADSALRFYTEFANPVKPLYSWNRALPRSQDFFIRGDLALYLGFASELFAIRDKNPNLDFDVTAIPQIRESSFVTTFGRIYGIAIVKQTDNVAGAFRVMTLLSGSDAGALWSEKMNLPPVRRDLLAGEPQDPYQALFYDEALIASAFLDPNSSETDKAFSDMVANITSGRLSISRAVADVSARLGAEIR